MPFAAKLFVDPDLGYQCLKSVSLNQTLATSYLSEITKYTQFQSTLSNLKRGCFFSDSSCAGYLLLG